MARPTTITTNIFKERLKEKHPNLTLIGDYVSARKKVVVMDEDGFEYNVLPANVLKSKVTVSTCTDPTGHFLFRAKKMHDKDLDTYEKTEYKTMNKKMIVTCKIHGDYLIAPRHYIVGSRCRQCNVENLRMSDFENRLRVAHSNLSLVGKYVNNRTKVEVEDEAGFRYFINPESLLRQKFISIKSCKTPTALFLYKALKVHSDDRDSFEKVEYVGKKSKIIVTCKNHGDYSILAEKYLNGQRCGQCKGGDLSAHFIRPYVEVIEMFREVFDEQYDYSKFEYKGNKIKSTIICRSCEEPFEQNFVGHLRGGGCPKCNVSHRGSMWYLNPDNYDRIAYCYLLHITGNDEDFYKVGITVDLKNRIRHILEESDGSYAVKKLQIIEIDAYTAYHILEKANLKYLRSKKYQYRPELDFAGRTECFKGSDLNADFKLIEPKFSGGELDKMKTKSANKYRTRYQEIVG